ncbi:KEOPS complex subunit Cgi121 [Methanogenium sp. MK-MG]|uniref:KEOPS complex subunit Cgi121 n=1 Tax=Methanogenium sp. MK-MG TaxID=2599926 RepID=UPI0013ECE363|nr:KEOPS complex subunit Cgi121 [Methanogenium sp. MK-MG]
MNDTAGPIMPPYHLTYADAEITDIPAFLAAVHTTAGNLGAHTRIICINADRVAGRLHITTALAHACRTWFTDKNPIARSFEMEVLLWVAAGRQTSVAARFGAQKGTMPLWVVVVAAEESPTAEIARLPGLTLYPAPPATAEEMGAEKQARLMQDFSISEAELSTVGLKRLPELVAERVALSAVYR